MEWKEKKIFICNTYTDTRHKMDNNDRESARKRNVQKKNELSLQIIYRFHSSFTHELSRLRVLFFYSFIWLQSFMVLQMAGRRQHNINKKNNNNIARAAEAIDTICGRHKQQLQEGKNLIMI